MKPVSCVNEKATLLIIAGGESRRMGKDKLLLPAPPREIPLVRHVVERLLPLAESVLVIANDARVCAALRQPGESGSDRPTQRAVARVQVDCLPDDEPGRGPLGGLATGLRRVEGWALAVAGDMPFVSPAVCKHLIGLADIDCDVIVPTADRQAQPLHALYHRRCLPAVERSLEAGLRRMDSFWRDARVRQIAADTLRPLDPELRTFVNVNTPAEWEEAVALLSQG